MIDDDIGDVGSIDDTISNLSGAVKNPSRHGLVASMTTSHAVPP